jgi:hypothetical protein
MPNPTIYPDATRDTPDLPGPPSEEPMDSPEPTDEPARLADRRRAEDPPDGIGEPDEPIEDLSDEDEDIDDDESGLR